MGSPGDSVTRPLPDILSFDSESSSPYRFGWDGPWPPPETMYLAIGKTTGYLSVLDSVYDVPRAQTVADVYRYALGKHSKLADDDTSGDLIPGRTVRGAAYKLVGKVDEPTPE